MLSDFSFSEPGIGVQFGSDGLQRMQEPGRLRAFPACRILRRMALIRYADACGEEFAAGPGFNQPSHRPAT